LALRLGELLQLERLFTYFAGMRGSDIQVDLIQNYEFQNFPLMGKNRGKLFAQGEFANIGQYPHSPGSSI